MQDVSIRFATDDDAAALRRVAQRDTRALPAGPHLVAEAEDRILVAHSLASGEAVADPFTRTAELRKMVEVRASQLADRDGRGHAPLVGDGMRGYPRPEAR